jgi:uncharacterized protein YabE (DUF348 family)
MRKKTKKFIIRHRRKARKKAKFLLKHPLLVPVSVFIAIVFFGQILFVQAGATTQGARDKRIVNVFVDGEKQTVSTRAKTVSELLERLDIRLIDEDIVEPLRESPILEDNTQINIYRARPVAVLDGDRTITVLTAHRSASLVARSAGLKLDPADEVRFDRATDGVLETASAEQVVVTRAVPLQFVAFGVLSQPKTTASTVGEFIERQGIELADDQVLQPVDTSTPISAGMLISITKEGSVIDAVREPIAFSVELRDDPSLTIGESRVEQAGVLGERAVIYEITQDKTGQETGRRELQTITTLAPIPEVRLRGTKLATLSPNINLSAEKTSLMAAAGIVEADYAYVDYIISKESGWRPGAINSSSGAYGLCQSLPASKMASAGADYLTNPVTQLRWCGGYASGRYGGWQSAYNAWLAQRWW